MKSGSRGEGRAAVVGFDFRPFAHPRVNREPRPMPTIGPLLRAPWSCLQHRYREVPYGFRNAAFASYRAAALAASKESAVPSARIFHFSGSLVFSLTFQVGTPASINASSNRFPASIKTAGSVQSPAGSGFHSVSATRLSLRSHADPDHRDTRLRWPSSADAQLLLSDN